MYKNREDVKPHLNDAKLDSNFFAEKKIEGDTHASANVILMEIHIVQNTFISKYLNNCARAFGARI